MAHQARWNLTWAVRPPIDTRPINAFRNPSSTKVWFNE
jgi:hypothetical protein